jgi:hypothetical protein
VRTNLKTSLAVGAGLAVVTAAIVGAGTIADLLPAALVAVCVVVLIVMCLAALAVKS